MIAARARVGARLRRLEARSANRPAIDPREAAIRWTERFQRAHPDLIQRVHDRQKVFPSTLLHSNHDRTPHAGLMWMFLMHQIPHLWVYDDQPDDVQRKIPPMPPTVPDPDVAAALFREFMITAARYQADHNDLFPMDHYRLQEVGKMEMQYRREERDEARAAVEEGRASLWRLSGSPAARTEKTPTGVGVEGA